MLQIIRPGYDQVAAIENEIMTTMAVIMLAIVGIWLLSMFIDKKNQIYARFGIVMTLEGLTFSIFMFVLVRPAVAFVIFLISAIFGVITTLISVKIDEIFDEEYEEEVRYRRAAAIKKFLRERGDTP